MSESLKKELIAHLDVLLDKHEKIEIDINATIHLLNGLGHKVSLQSTKNRRKILESLHKTNENSEDLENLRESIGKIPSVAVLEFFKDNPDEYFKPGQVRDHLVELKEKGKLKSDAQKLIWSANNILTDFFKKDILIKKQLEGRSVAYKLKE